MTGYVLLARSNVVRHCRRVAANSVQTVLVNAVLGKSSGVIAFLLKHRMCCNCNVCFMLLVVVFVMLVLN